MLIVLRFFYILCFLFMTSCQPIEYGGLRDGISKYLLERERSIRERFERFKSDKLDLVFVLNTGPGMEKFYQNAFFGTGFLSQFEKYDWRFAYTDMSVSADFIAQAKNLEEGELEENQGQSCSALAYLTNTVLFVGTTMIEAHYFAALAVHNIYRCLFKNGKRKKKRNGKCRWKRKEKCPKIFANGEFLPFEYEGEVLNLKGLNSLAKSIENYSEVFDHTLKLSNKRAKKYDAPVQKVHEAYPYLSMILSMAQGAYVSADYLEDQKASPFFRDDSVIVYVLVTAYDMEYSIPFEEFEADMESVFGDKNRLKIIPVTVRSDSSVMCKHYNKVPSTQPHNIIALADRFGSRSLDICSRTLAQELFFEISKSLVSL